MVKPTAATFTGIASMVRVYDSLLMIYGNSSSNSNSSKSNNDDADDGD